MPAVYDPKTGYVWTQQPCDYCGEDFWADNASYIYCSDRCKEAKNEAWRYKRLQWHWRKCEICGAPFKVKRSKQVKTQRTCGNSCGGKLAWRTRQANLAAKE